MGEAGRRGARGLNIETLPYSVRVYANNQVLIPARLVRKLGMQAARFALVKIRIKEQVYELRVRLLRTKYTDSRQFTIPKEIREKHGSLAGTIVEVLEILPLPAPEQPSQAEEGSA